MGPTTATKCPDHQRLDFLPRHAAGQFLIYEQTVYAYMYKACSVYRGGVWDYYSLSNGGFFMAWDVTGSVPMEWPDNFYDGEMSARAASIAVNLMVQGHLCASRDAERFIRSYRALSRYAAEHDESGEIFRFID